MTCSKSPKVVKKCFTYSVFLFEARFTLVDYDGNTGDDRNQANE